MWSYFGFSFSFPIRLGTKLFAISVATQSTLVYTCMTATLASWVHVVGYFVPIFHIFSLLWALGVHTQLSPSY